MALAHGYALPFEALRRTGVLAQNTADATIRATADGATKEAAGSCLDARALEVQQRTVVQPSILVVPQLTRNGVVLNQLPNTRTNFIQNNTMVGATGSVRPNLWDLGSLPSGFTISYSASGQTTAADGTLVDYIDVTVSGTALASGFLNLRQTTSPSPVSGNLLFASGMTYTASVYLALLSGSLTGVATNVMALQEIANTTFVANTTFAPVTGITSELTRFTGTRTIEATGGADRTSVRWGHSITSGTSYDYTVRIASPQLEKGSIATPVIRTASGFVTVDAGGTARDGAPPDFTFTRATTATRVNASGLIESVASGVPRIDWLGQSCPALLVEPAATNQIRNNSMVGAVAGSPGTMPTNWAESLNGLVRQSVALGTENGVSYIDIRYSGTATGGSCAVLFETATQIVASTGQTWSNSVYLKIIAQPNPPVAYRLAMWEYNTSGTVFGGSFATAVVPTTTSLQRFTQTRALTGATTDRVRPLFGVSMTSGQSYDFTIRIGYPQMEQSSFATSPIPTTSAAVSRAADSISASGALVSGLIGQTEGTIYAEVDVRNAGTNCVICLSNNSSSMQLRIRASINSLVIANTLGGSTTSKTLSPTLSGVNKIALSYASGDYAVYLNGTQLDTYSDLNPPTPLIRIDLGMRQNNTEFFNDRIRAAALYTTRLSNDQLAELTRL